MLHGRSVSSHISLSKLSCLGTLSSVILHARPVSYISRQAKHGAGVQTFDTGLFLSDIARSDIYELEMFSIILDFVTT